MFKITISIPEEVLLDNHLTKQNSENYAKQAVALFYYTKLGVSLGYCSLIAGMKKIDFIRFLSENGVSIFDNEDEDNFKEDTANA